MSRQDEILGLHPINHHVIGEWLDYEDKEPVTIYFSILPAKK